MSYKDTAEELGISVSAVNKHIVKGLRTLREKLKGKQSARRSGKIVFAARKSSASRSDGFAIISG